VQRQQQVGQAGDRFAKAGQHRPIMARSPIRLTDARR
jgi:hypothetical protein